MATNKNALIRYRTIDICLQNRSRRWTLDDLIQACSEALYEYEGKDSYVSKRTVQLDIQMMRSDKLGYNAPIIVKDRKYYTYEDDTYSITKLPIDQIDMEILQESMEMLRQFKDFTLFSELGGVIQKLEDKIYRESTRQQPIIHMDRNEQLKGLYHLDALYQAISKQLVLNIHYQSFKARESGSLIIHPYILKEFNNRWFLIGRKEESEQIMTLALDRIEGYKYMLSVPYDSQDFDADRYYKDTYGVTVMNEGQLMDVVLKIDAYNAPYVLTKPFHHSQHTVQKHENGSVTIRLCVHDNYEFTRLILGFGSGIEVIGPRRLKSRIKREISKTMAVYGKDINP